MANQRDIFQQRQTQDLISHIIDASCTGPEFLWEKSPNFCIFRNDRNRKWFALVAQITARQLGLDRLGKVEIINLRFDRHQAPDFISTNDHFFPAYYMNKQNWYSVLLDDTLDDELIYSLVEHSFSLVTTG